MNKFLLVSFYFLIFHSIFLCFSQTISPDDLRCEYQLNPLGIDIEKPHFSWILRSEQRNQMQTAYELIISDNYNDIHKKKGNIWTTGKVPSSENIHVEYKGTPLKPFSRYFWRVKVYDKKGKSSMWSNPAWFETAALKNSDWNAAWISDGKKQPLHEDDFYKDNPAPTFRKVFDGNKKIKYARLYIAGLGYYKASINGDRVGNNVLDPGWTAYDKQVLYSTYDITNHIRQGKNVISITLGNGWYNPLPLRMWGKWNLREQLTIGDPCTTGLIQITYTDGSKDIIPTDHTWQVIPSPILRNNIYLGEHYDARLEQETINNPETVLENPRYAVKVPGPQGKLTAQLQPPIRVIQVVKPLSIREIQSGIYIVDMGQNFAGVARIHVKGKAGTKIRLRYGEDIHKDGSLNIMTTVAGQIKQGNGGLGAPSIAWQEDSYILKGGHIESWSPDFTFHGFRYVEVTGWPGKLNMNDIEGLCLSADVEEAGKFSCSNPMFNKLMENIRWTFRSNLFSVQSDCPAREKFGYGGDMFCTTNAFSFNYDMSNFYRKIIQDHVNDQRPSGAITETNPYMGIADFGTAPDDGSGPISFQIGFPFLIKHLYDFYGDKRIVSNYYNAFKKQAEYLIGCSKNNLMTVDISDHESLDEKPYKLTASAWYYYHIQLIAEFAQLLDKPSDAQKYTSLAKEIKQAIIDQMFDKSTGVFDNGTQSAQIFGLWFSLVEGEDKNAAFERLLETIKSRDGHLSTGIFATKMMFDVFRALDRNDVAYRIANKRDFPGWGYMIENGATTLWETWAYSDNTYSQNHPMFGSISEWFYRSILGINPASPGFEKIVIKPQPVEDLIFAKGYYKSIRGVIASSWDIIGNTFHLQVEIPVNCTAEIWIPSTNGTLTESGKPIEQIKDMLITGHQNNYTIVSVGSGKYTFRSFL